MRESGMLLPVASLPSKYGIGTFSKEAYAFVDMLVQAGQSYWQVLPLGPTGYGDSPYQSFSTFAGNPYFIDLDQLMKEGLLSKEACESLEAEENEEGIDYERIWKTRYQILKKAYLKKNLKDDQGYHNFCAENAPWLEDYSLYMAIKEQQEGKPWIEWEEDIRLRQKTAVSHYKDLLRQEIEFHNYLQYEFQKQWKQLKAYANKKGIRMIGDIPIYVAFDSADTWSNPQLFQLDKDHLPTAVAGCPPDAFSDTGQLWGNPLYRWDQMKKDGYTWWMNRIAHCMQLYDKVRIDHFRGFESYYCIPYGEETAVNGTWEPGPGLEFFQTAEARFGRLPIIAEDLGYLTDAVKKLLKESGYPGMKVLQFAYDSEDSSYLPHNHIKNCILYTGTHDNETTLGWLLSREKNELQYLEDYMEVKTDKREQLLWKVIIQALSSVADICIIPVQDYLGLDNKARINTPSTLGSNWCWRMPKDAFPEELISIIKKKMFLYGRYKKD